MAEAEIQRYHQLAALTVRVARAAAELEAARADLTTLPTRQAAELDELTDRLRALHLLVANEVERAWNAAEADARRTRRAQLMGRVHDAVSAETTLPSGGDLWRTFGPNGPEGPLDDRLIPPEPSG